MGNEEEFELRVVIWRVENINVFKGSSGASGLRKAVVLIAQSRQTIDVWRIRLSGFVEAFK